MQQKKLVQALVSIGLIGLLAACGGGSSSSTGSSGSGGTPVSNGTVNMFVTDGPSEVFNHVWVTFTAISFHTDPNAVWSSSDASWKTVNLSAPMTVDLAQLNNGAMSNIFAGLNLPNGTYKQIRFLVLGDQDPLSNAAQATLNNQSPQVALQWNDQVEYVNSSGVLSEAPLEIANPVQGIRLDGSFTVSAGAPLNIATDFDLEKIIVPFHHGAMQSFTMKPTLAYFNLNNSGAITGQVNPTGLCTTNASGYFTSTPPSSCSFNLIVHAEAVSSDGTRYEAVRSTSVNPLTGAFTVAPLPITDDNGNALTYDIVVRGRQMQTLVITGVQPTGSFSLSNGSETLSGGTILGTTTTPLPVTNVQEYPTNLASALSPLTSGQVIFEQTFNNGSVTLPHEIRWTPTDAFSGLIDRHLLAPWNQGYYLTNDNLQVAAYSTSGLTFASVTPSELTGNYSVIANEHVYYNFGTATTLLSNQSATVAAPDTFTPNPASLASGVVSGTVTGTATIGTLNANSNGSAVSSAYVVLARNAGIISATPIDAANPGCFVANSATPCTYSFTGVGAGTAASPVPGAYYYVYIRVQYADGSHKIVPASGYADLRQSASATPLNVTVSI